MNSLKHYCCILIILYFINCISCHMFIKNISFQNNNNINKYSYPRRSQYNPFYIEKNDMIDYNMMSPLFDFDNRTYPCRGYKRENHNLNVIYNNQEIIINFNETNNKLDFHNGGVIQQYSIALEKNDYKNFTVIKNISGEEIINLWKNNIFDVKINVPSNIMSDNIILAWSWFSDHLVNKVEFFMNCIDLKLKNNNNNVKHTFNNINDIIIPCQIKNDNINDYCNLKDIKELK